MNNMKVEGIHEAIDKIYEKLLPINDKLACQFLESVIEMEPEIKLGVDEDGNSVATLLSVKFNLKNKAEDK